MDEERRAVVGAFVVHRAFRRVLPDALRLDIGESLGKKLMFMSDEFGQWGEWNHDLELDWHLTGNSTRAGLQQWVRDLNATYRAEPALYERDDSPEGFEWIDCSDHEANVVVFVRRAADANDMVLFACNLSAVPRHDYRVGAPVSGSWAEILNSDASVYGGSGQGNFGAVETSDTPSHGRPWSLSLTLLPLAVVAFRAPRPATSAGDVTMSPPATQRRLS